MSYNMFHKMYMIYFGKSVLFGTLNSSFTFILTVHFVQSIKIVWICMLSYYTSCFFMRVYAYTCIFPSPNSDCFSNKIVSCSLLDMADDVCCWTWVNFFRTVHCSLHNFSLPIHSTFKYSSAFSEIPEIC